MTSLLNVLCGEFYINMILTSKITHFAERQVVCPSYSVYHTARMNIQVNLGISNSDMLNTPDVSNRVLGPDHIYYII
jgi:hypothetical protein